MVKQKKRKVPVVPLCVASVLIVAGIVFVGFALGGKGARLNELRNEVQAISGWRGRVTDFLGLKVKDVKLSDEEKNVIVKFEDIFADKKKVETIRDIAKNGDEKTKNLVGEIVELYEDVRELYDVEQEVAVMFDGELSDDELAKLSGSKNELLRGMADDLRAYRADVKGLTAKDGDFEKKYKALVGKGEELKKKYANVSLEGLLGKKKEEVLVFFDKVDELNNYLQERK